MPTQCFCITTDGVLCPVRFRIDRLPFSHLTRKRRSVIFLVFQRHLSPADWSANSSWATQALSSRPIRWSPTAPSGHTTQPR